jgi:protein-tyrosine kinase
MTRCIECAEDRKTGLQTSTLAAFRRQIDLARDQGIKPVGKIYNALERYRKERHVSAQAGRVTQADLAVLSQYDRESGELDLDGRDPAAIRRLLDAGLLTHEGVVTRAGRQSCENVQLEAGEFAIVSPQDEQGPAKLPAGGLEQRQESPEPDIKEASSANFRDAVSSKQIHAKNGESPPIDKENSEFSAAGSVSINRTEDFRRRPPTSSGVGAIRHEVRVAQLPKPDDGLEAVTSSEQEATPHERKEKEERSPERELDGTLAVDPQLVLISDPHSFEAEQFKILRSNILFPADGKPPQTILVTSMLPGEGKSFVAANLAISVARNINRHVLLIDCDLRNPTIHFRLGVGEARGLSAYLTRDDELEPYLFKTRVDKLTVLPAGDIPENPSELLSSERMISLLAQVKARYTDRLVILDSPPQKLSAEASVLAQYVDGVVLVVRYGSTPQDVAADFVRRLGRDKFIGCVLNDFHICSLPYLGKSYDGYRYSKYFRHSHRK